MKNITISIIYFIIGFISILLLNHASFWPGFVAKALIIPVLMILYLVNINMFTNRLHIMMFGGLIFSWAGDITLEFTSSNGNFFMIGLVCFLLAHIMYLTVFLMTPGKNFVIKNRSWNRSWLLVPVITYGIGLVFYLYEDLGEMRLPVIIYAAVILTMLTTAINRENRVKKRSYYMVLCGAILFVISDSSIAVSRFSHQFESSGILIMSTYIVAQYMIVAGIIDQFIGVGTYQITR